MTVTLTAPITEAEFRTYPGPPLPTDFSGDRVTRLLNSAWAALNTRFGVNQPLTQTESTDTYEFPSRYANMRQDGEVQIAPRYLPIISVTSLSWTYSANQYGWMASSIYDILTDTIIMRDSSFNYGDTGAIKLVYKSGFATIPDDLKLACALMAQHLFSATFFPTQAGTSVLPAYLPNDVKEIMARYKRVR